MKDLTTGNEAGLIFRFALPMVIGNLFQQLYNIVDSIIVGKFLGTEALAAVGASFPIFYTLISFFIGIGSGATIVISQYFGAKNYEKVKQAIGTIYLFMFGAGIILSIIGILFSRQIFTLLGIGDDVMPQALAYFNVYMLGMVGFFGFNSTSSVLRGLGDSRTPLLFLAIATVVNIVLDVVFIVVFKWGVAGAAWATVIAQMGAFISAIFYLNKRDHLIHFSIKSLTFDVESFRKSVKIGLPTGFQQTFVALGLMGLIRIINNFDTVTLAAYTAASRIDALAAMPAMVLASALSAFVGQNLGAGKVERIRKGVWATQKMAWTISLAVMLIVLLWGNQLMSLFNDDPEVIRQGREYLIIVCSFYIVFSSMFVLHGTLRGAGDTIIPMIITLISLWIVRIPFAWFLSKHFGESGIWWSIPAGWMVGLAGTWIYYKSGRWKRKSVVEKTPIPRT
ncbi:MATE family efflux transporter [Alkalitalea saponilacus]|uniref:Multidrug-efflux transporter n=1 Tax=Alkalitalea saponilacus TaxID=889453 RepID=A0A1T5HT38_9BACT|nr:MATE family efflux transporter [Alkalitalea saponilacus]ASB47749.1 MATE family efflux transporter [Alkalitalea saponilacus]SKC23680.1 putative efflux protein, MATE family [Alkalitalea saponilacus]